MENEWVQWGLVMLACYMVDSIRRELRDIRGYLQNISEFVQEQRTKLPETVAEYAAQKRREL